jgi:hypothetical protein
MMLRYAVAGETQIDSLSPAAGIRNSRAGA